MVLTCTGNRFFSQLVERLQKFQSFQFQDGQTLKYHRCSNGYNHMLFRYNVFIYYFDVTVCLCLVSLLIDKYILLFMNNSVKQHGVSQ